MYPEWNGESRSMIQKKHERSDLNRCHPAAKRVQSILQGVESPPFKCNAFS